MRYPRAEAGAFLFFVSALFLALCGPALAQSVTLTSDSGELAIEGTMLGFDGEFYRVNTPYGELTVDASAVSCAGEGCPDLDPFVARLRISGTETVGRVLMPALIEAFAQRKGMIARREETGPGRLDYRLRDIDTGELKAVFSLKSSTSDVGFEDLLAGKADVVMSRRAVRSQENARARDLGLGDLSARNRSRVLALDALVPVMSGRQQRRSIDMAQFVGILTGELDNWAQVGGPNAPISLHLRHSSDGIAQALEDHVTGPTEQGLSERAIRHVSDASLIQAVANDPNAIGVSSFSETGNVRVLSLSGPCGYGLGASRRTIKTEDYPLTAPMTLYLPARRLPALAREFLRFTRSDPAQIVIRRAGFVDQSPEEVTINEQGSRLVNAIRTAGREITLDEMKEMIDRLSPMNRLTTSFRFTPGSTQLDAQSASNVHQLARAIDAGKYGSRELLFVGFSDGQGEAQDNLGIALERAETLLDAVRRAADPDRQKDVRMDVVAYGEALPMACDDTEWGRQVNRRVEVWIK